MTKHFVNSNVIQNWKTTGVLTEEPSEVTTGVPTEEPSGVTTGMPTGVPSDIACAQ